MPLLVVHGSIVQDIPLSLSPSATVLFLHFSIMVVLASDVSLGGSFLSSPCFRDGVLSLSICVSVVMVVMDEGACEARCDAERDGSQYDVIVSKLFVQHDNVTYCFG
mmetsp:Transcript_36556/g.88592  ORF Transcript_36556/g.88592 Transcript_36556/m.88592 type:complete len:107 (-) Transcript_36556:115-435(-)